MIGFKYRFHGHGSLAFLFRKGWVIRDNLLTIKYLPNKYRKTSRFSVIISKKITKKAVLRNRIRRRLYEIIRTEIIPQTNEVYDIAIIINSVNINDLSYLEIKSKVISLFQKANLL